MIAVLIVFLTANEKKGIWWKQYQNETEKRQRQGSVTVSNAIERKINTQKNKTGTVHQQDRDERATTITTAQKKGTGHWQDREKIATTVKTSHMGYAC